MTSCYADAGIRESCAFSYKCSFHHNSVGVFNPQTKMQLHYLFRLFSVFAIAGLAAGRRPLIRAPRDAKLTGDHLIVLDSALSKEDFHRLLARISKVSDGAAVHSYVENVAKVITASLSPYAMEIVSAKLFS